MVKNDVKRKLSQGELKAMEAIICSSDAVDKKELIEKMYRAEVRPCNDDGSVVEFIEDDRMETDFAQRILFPTGIVQDESGVKGEVILYIDRQNRLKEIEIISIEEKTIGIPVWETFRIII